MTGKMKLILCGLIWFTIVASLFFKLSYRNNKIKKCLNSSCHNDSDETKIARGQVGGSGVFHESHNIPQHLLQTDQLNPQLAEHIRTHWMVHPLIGRSSRAVNLTEDTSQIGQSSFVDKLLDGKVGGFFVECGAGDGEYLSNSLFFETKRNWTGLLVEPNTELFSHLSRTHRNAHLLNACLSPTRHPETLDMTVAGLYGGLEEHMDKAHVERISAGKSRPLAVTSVQCFPLYSVLKALNITHVDYFSLDVEGAEVDILETIPFDLLTIEVFSIEYRVTGDWGATYRKARRMMDILVGRHGYSVSGYLRKQDIILKKRHSIDR